VVDPASRLQFALTTVVHIVFPVVTMRHGPFLVYFTWKEIRTERVIYEQLRRFWTRIFAVSFVVGTVTGLVLEFEFGTNFAAFSSTAGELLGGPLALEGMMAFMLEATSSASSCSAATASATPARCSRPSPSLSAVWILITKSWMQTPAGTTSSNGTATRS
jgi:cytochrome d ubiquinol oxidase subunit I